MFILPTVVIPLTITALLLSNFKKQFLSGIDGRAVHAVTTTSTATAIISPFIHVKSGRVNFTTSRRRVNALPWAITQINGFSRVEVTITINRNSRYEITATIRSAV